MMEKRDQGEGKQRGGELKGRLRGVRRRKQVYQCLGQDGVAFKVRLARARGRVGR
ncbi:MAG: hypothetical protein U9R72_01565 [Chloroflexota bacterium]|nr:hypothetical protein [Chloroflexota bacterium]